jgi:hypothetical protein
MGRVRCRGAAGVEPARNSKASGTCAHGARSNLPPRALLVSGDGRRRRGSIARSVCFCGQCPPAIPGLGVEGSSWQRVLQAAAKAQAWRYIHRQPT